ncbi:MAG TPA: S-layer homology domain-containing protein, partial [Symbiobacteriaceae bacterium]|nr:S-layer homology domain-containing protein [Symbiobacteriaceae bacterium]
ADVPEIGRTYWSWGGRQGDYTVGHAAATVDGQSWSLALPVQQIDGQTYVEMEWVSRLLADPVRLVNGRVQIGLDDIRGHWAQSLIVQLVREGVVSGAGAGRFGPNDPLTRAAFVKMLVGARQLAPRPGDAGRFSDTGDHWVTAQGYIGAAVQAGFVVPSEYPDGRFEPDLPISREDMAVMVTRALGLDATARMRGLSLSLSDGAATIDGRTFTDAATWTRPGYVAVAVEQGIINGYAADGGSFTYGPFRQATRAEAVAMIVRMRNK